MRLLAACALAACATAYAQLTVDEASTHAKLVDNATSVLLALDNRFGKPVDVRVDLQWLDPKGTIRARAQLPFTAPPGKSSAETRLPLADPDGEALFYRLRYSVMPDSKNLTAFTPRVGMLSFPYIADYAFRLSVVGIARPRIGQPYEFRVFAAHPVTGKPVAGVKARIGDVVATTDVNGAAIIRLQPDRKDSEQMLTVEGRLGDLAQSAEAWRPPLPGNAVRIYTDKPLDRWFLSRKVIRLVRLLSGRISSSASR